MLRLVDCLNSKRNYVEKEQIPIIDEFERKINTPRHRRLLEISSFQGDDLVEIRAVINEIIIYAEFDNRLDYIKAFNSFFSSLDLRAKDGNKISRICQIEKCMSPLEIEFRLLKDLQCGDDPTINAKSRGKLSEIYDISVNSIDKYLGMLANGVDILGSRVQIALNRASNNYDSTIHPVFLALNLSEVYMLTVLLKSVFGSQSIPVVADIYRQLSEYAKAKVDTFAQRDCIDLFDGKECESIPRGYRAEKKDDPFYFAKSGEKCMLSFEDEYPKIRIGRITFSAELPKEHFLFTDDKTMETRSFPFYSDEIKILTQAI